MLSPMAPFSPLNLEFCSKHPPREMEITKIKKTKKIKTVIFWCFIITFYIILLYKFFFNFVILCFLLGSVGSVAIFQ